MTHFLVKHANLSISKNDMGMRKTQPTYTHMNTDIVFYILVSNILILLKENAVALDSAFVYELLRAMSNM
jgi:hypothetical protein